MALRTFTSAGVNNLWSNAANWDTAPVDTDGFTMSAGQTCEFDADQSAWAGMAASTIPAGCTLIASTTAGSYVLKMNADLTVAGTLQAGTSTSVPYPSTCTFAIDFSATNNSILRNAGGSLKLYCTQPTNRAIYLSGAEAIGQTEWSVNTDVTGDEWHDGDTVVIIDTVYGNPEAEERVIAAGGIAAGTITVTVGLTAAKNSGAIIGLINRNVRLINSAGGDYYIKYPALGTDATGDYIGCEMKAGYISIAQGAGWEFAGVTNGKGIVYYSNGGTISGCCFIPTYNSAYHGASAVYGLTVTNTAIIAGTNYAIVSCTNVVNAGLMFANNYNHVGDIFTGTAKYSYIGATGGPLFIDGATFVGNEADIQGSYFIASNCELTGTYGMGSNTNCGTMYNVLVSSGTEFNAYNDVRRSRRDYVESFDHDQVVNAFKAWCRGGTVLSQTTSPPSGYTIFYDHEVESATYPCFRQYLTTVNPGTAIEVSAVIRNTDGIDVSATSPIDLRPRLEIIDVFADPLVDSTKTALASMAIAISDGSNTDWQPVNVIWANPAGGSPKQVEVRIICYSHDASTHTIDEAWSVADYQDQINETLQRVKRIGLTSEF